MQVTDAVALDGARITDSGYLEANARTARTGIQQYWGSEIGLVGDDLVNVYRDASEVFSKTSLQTFSKLPVTMGHPGEMVDASNWRDYAVGVSGDEVLRDGEYLKIGLKITDAAAVKAIQNGTRELSVGYTTELVFEDGVAPDGTPYQARQTNIIANHIAIVPHGRAGSEVRIGDDAAKWGVQPVGDASTPKTEANEERRSMTRTIMIDGVSVDVTDKDAQIVQRHIDALTKRADDAERAASASAAAHDKALAAKDADHAKALAGKDAEHAKAVAAKDAEISEKEKALAAKDAEIDSLKEKVLDDAAIDARVAERSDLIGKARAIAPKIETKGLSDAAIRKAAVVAALGDTVINGKSEAYIDARFDILIDALEKADPVGVNAKFSTPFNPVQVGDAREKAHTAMVDGLTSAWSRPTTKEH